MTVYRKAPHKLAEQVIESRAYKASTGAWDRIKPSQNFSTRGGLGAWELAAGYDYLNLNDGIITGGRASTAKFGINWYPNSHIRLMANFIHTLNIDTQGVTAGGQPATAISGLNASNGAATRSQAYNSANFDVVELRGQVDF